MLVISALVNITELMYLKSNPVVGKPIPRREDPKLLRGAGSFIDDLNLPDMLHGKILRSPYAHADIRSINISKAAAKKGVFAAITSKDALELSKKWGATDKFPYDDDFAIATKKVLYVGHEVAAVAAVDQATAEDALDLIEVEYGPLTPVLSYDKAIEAEAPLLHDELKFSQDTGNIHSRMVLETGDVEVAFQKADEIIRKHFEFSRTTAGYMEPAACVASFDPIDGYLTLWNQSQWPHLHQYWLSSVFNIPMSKIRVIVKDVGGSFGPKSEYMHHEAIAVL
ncbi:MAG: molybdopterin-dependent oxidoreductase, partial [Nitrososphaerota archaeon]|nr:molybdopterin-dependent oxidoreductase [Nitrososphaerota archaeon]